MFIEEAYTSVIFSDDDFLEKSGVVVCSVEMLISVFNSAKEDKNLDVLRLFSAIHRKARLFLDSNEMKARIRKSLGERESKLFIEMIITT